MDKGKIQVIDMHIERIVHYSMYVDCLVRIIKEITENGIYNLNPSDIPNMLLLLSKYSKILRIIICNLSRDWRFYEKSHKKIC